MEGPERADAAERSGAELVLVFHPAFDTSKGSKHLAEMAERAAIEVRVFAA
ncbi:MAG TPA: hypothetical protein VGE74_01175 [Gemmata sp.]